MKKARILLSILVLSISSLFVFATPHAFAATKTWTGGGSDNNMATAANWGGVAPSAGDDLVFPVSAARHTITNDYTAATSFNSITFTGAVTASSDAYNISGNSITLVAGIDDQTTGSVSHTQILNLAIILNGSQTVHAVDIAIIKLQGVISGSGTLTFSGEGLVRLLGANTFTGNVVVLVHIQVESPTGLGTAAGSTDIQSTGKVIYLLSESNKVATITEPFIFTVGADEDGQSALRANADCVSLSSFCPDSDITFSGAMTFAQDTLLSTVGKLTLSGALSGSGKSITLTLDSGGTLVLNGSSNNTASANGTYGAGVVTNMTLSANSPTTNLTIPDKNTWTVTGTYGATTVMSGGVLKGTGTVGGTNVLSGGTIAPGTSPGCLNTGNLTLQSGSVYQAEIGGTTVCTEYDQLKVTGTVDITGSALGVSRFNGFKPVKGQTYTIISNDGSDAVTGTFSGLAEGATFSVDGYVFKISYAGGDGNDVVITVQSVPAAPNTGFTLIKDNPILTASLMTAAAGGILIASRRKFAHSTRRK